MSLRQRVWATVSGAFLSMNLLIVATPLTVSWPPKPWEIACSLTGVIIVSIISWRAIERGFAPVQKVARQIAETPNLDDAAPIQAVPQGAPQKIVPGKAGAGGPGAGRRGAGGG